MAINVALIALGLTPSERIDEQLRCVAYDTMFIVWHRITATTGGHDHS